MSSGISEGLLLQSGVDPSASPPGDSSPPRNSNSPGYDSSSDRASARKRTNTTSSANGEKRTANKICRVCGDKAFSYNFNVITCESCKAFFRRNANKEKDIRCPFNEQCEINIVSRRFCQRCRLAKCFEVGMKKEWIMTDEARLEKKQRVEENRERRLQDAMNRSENQGGQSPQDRRNSDTANDEYSNSPVGSLTVKDFVLQSEDMKTMINNIQEEQKLPLGLITCNSHNFIDSIPTTAANSLADVSSTTSIAQTMDIDPSTTMSSSGFLPPSLDNVGTILPSVDTMMAQAHAQLAAQVQVQAAINHQQQQQIAAAVVANQVAAQIVLAPTQQTMQQTLPQTLPTALPPLTKPVLQATLPTPILTTNLPQPTQLLQQLSAPDMVTIPRDVLVKLIENNTMRAANCKCTCVCGRYPPGSVIVDEVTKDLIASGGQNNANGPTPDDNKDQPARLETTEDFQRNGLLPSEESSVQWLNSSQPTVVDPSNIMDITQDYSMDSYYPNATVLETQMQSVSVSLDPSLWMITGSDRSLLNELEVVNHCWRESQAGKYKTARLRLKIHSMIKCICQLSFFRSLSQNDQIQIIKNRALLYLSIRDLYVSDPNENRVLPDIGDDWPFGRELVQQCSRLFSSMADDLKRNETIVSVLSLLALFDVNTDVRDKEAVCKLHEHLTDLLRRVMYAHFRQDEVRARTEFRNSLNLLANANNSALLTMNVAGWDVPQVANILFESLN